MLVCLGQLLLLLVDIVIASEDQCKFGIFRLNPDKIDTKLDGYNIRTFEKISPRVCFDKCIRRPKCHSYNYNRHILRCELNFRPECVFVDDFYNEVGFVYVEVDHYRGVIQRRIDGSENFRRTWVEYENGFGDLQNEFWLGNKYLHVLTSSGSYKVRVELVNTNGNMYYAKYSTFAIDDAASRYKLTMYGYSGNAGSWMGHNNGKYFWTFDRDNDGEGNNNCAASNNGWWYGWSSNSFLNDDFSNGLKWGNYFQTSQMMIQRTT
ncbi:Fibrinogen-like protein A [Mytilus coruscus]|uniref:Fibrinogen-like protein A n=1 Tax=Mytilus coruscus TaxID=42192 RepID=A0A6J8DIR0_MYTCO|nr:Fibrinogen-like protein A [Mytilus coruscus]